MSVISIIAAKNVRNAGFGAAKVMSRDLPDSDSAVRVPESGSDVKKQISDALSLVASYIPTEIVALYTVVLATLGPETGLGIDIRVFWGFLIGTPAVVWLVYAVSRVEGKLPVPWRFGQWPLWEMVSASVAFVAWSAAMPGGAFIGYGWYDSRIFGVVLIGISLFLPLVGVLVTGRKRETG